MHGDVGHDIAVFPADETLLLERMHAEPDRMRVHSLGDCAGTTWIYATPTIRLGYVNTTAGDGGRRYRRTLDADEIQYQVSGIRTLVTQRGIVELRPGDFVRIPLGLAHAGIPHQRSTHVSLLSHLELPQVIETTRTADPYSPERLAAAVERSQV